MYIIGNTNTVWLRSIERDTNVNNINVVKLICDGIRSKDPDIELKYIFYKKNNMECFHEELDKYLCYRLSIKIEEIERLLDLYEGCLTP